MIGNTVSPDQTAQKLYQEIPGPQIFMTGSNSDQFASLFSDYSTIWFSLKGGGKIQYLLKPLYLFYINKFNKELEE
jgi:hypothetical protein